MNAFYFFNFIINFISIATVYGCTIRGWNPGRAEIFRTCPVGFSNPPSLLYKCYRIFPGGKERPGRNADPSPLLVPWSTRSRNIPLHPPWAALTVQSLSATVPQCLKRVHILISFIKRIFIISTS